ncbi:hypothetical protein HB761_01265 [Vibrio campbellii]|uniref:Uncharacterized protein n=1 Tax=Vibrio campbellii TaxID=680 RepID=A0AAE9SJK2_9VIBR|nr:hypothetical protein [Vibrio campbellii]UTZ25491.1 hypothetical protein HB761_01265 [Vibrio campbellii]
MKKLLTLLFIGLTSFNVYAESQTGKVGQINLYGENWSNGHRGEILFKLDNMPSDARLFRITKSDIAFNTLLSTLLSVKHAKTTITVHYNVDHSANKYAPVKAITIE